MSNKLEAMELKWHQCLLLTLKSANLMLLVLVLLVQCQRSLAESCNEFVCGSVVSKCLLTQSCQCKLSDCYCCKDCLNCLGELFTECCHCLDMCPKHNDTLSALAPKSQIGDFEGVAELFDTLTAEDDEEEWTIMRFPMRSGLKQRFNANGNIVGGGGGAGGSGFTKQGATSDAIDREASLQKTPSLNVNCTVIYLNACTTNRKCTQYCESMGASSYRWFHDGCCECVGSHCLNYGINESRCSECPEDEEANGNADDEDADTDDDYGDDPSTWDYGEDELNFN